MAKLNSNYKNLQAGYLFPEIGKRVKKFQNENPTKKVIKLGLGDTVLPLPKHVVKGIKKRAEELGETKTYTGYGDSEGEDKLRQKIKDYYSGLGVEVEIEEIFVSDGAKPDTANISTIFAPDSVIAVQDPVYPVYVDSNVILGRENGYSNGRYKGIVYLDCSPENNFVPEIPDQDIDLVYLCYPNNPTGGVASKEELQKWVDYANKEDVIIIYDAAYSWFIQDQNIPKSIYEISGSQKCAIEIQSFSKFAGFTGVRLGWSVVPKTIENRSIKSGEVNQLWTRRQNTFFNGASNLAQTAGEYALSKTGILESRELIEYYMHNAKIIKESLTKIGFECYGGDNAPYIWAKTKNNISSWDFFDLLLERAGVVCTPGSGFGKSGEGYFRLSAFGNRNNIIKALSNIEQAFLN